MLPWEAVDLLPGSGRSLNKDSAATEIANGTGSQDRYVSENLFFSGLIAGDIRLPQTGEGEQKAIITIERGDKCEGPLWALGFQLDGADPGTSHVLFQNANLSDIPGISGTLQSQGTFSGTLDREEMEGDAIRPDFRVHGSTHIESLPTVFRAMLDVTAGSDYR